MRKAEPVQIEVDLQTNAWPESELAQRVSDVLRREKLVPPDSEQQLLSYLTQVDSRVECGQLDDHLEGLIRTHEKILAEPPSKGMTQPIREALRATVTACWRRQEAIAASERL